MGWAPSASAALREAEVLAHEALSLDDGDVRAHVLLGQIQVYFGRYEPALAELDRAVAAKFRGMDYILKAGGLGTGGLNFDAKVRREWLDPADLVAARAGAMDVCARALLVAAKLVEEERSGGRSRSATRGGTRPRTSRYSRMSKP